MHKRLKQNGIILVSTAVVVALTRILLASASLNSGEQENKYRNIVDVENAAAALTKEYHDTVNKLFNERIKTMVGIGKTNEPADLAKLIKLISPPRMQVDSEGAPVGRVSCSNPEENILSTYCLSDILVGEYFKYRAAMIEARKAARLYAVQRFEFITGSSTPQSTDPLFEIQPLLGRDVTQGSKTIQQYGEVINQVDRELDIARKALDQGLSAYNELQMALPMHLKYKQVIGSLEDFRAKLRDIRYEIDKYPTSFLNITSSACT